MKVAVVGGGSTYTPELVDGIARLQNQFGVDELVLIDPAEERLELVAGISQRIFDKYGYPGRLTFTTDLDRAVGDAAVVLLQLRVGGQAARAVDESLPLRCGCVGQETTGAGGLAKALRTVPVILQIAERVSQLAAKDAWIIDFTNPVGIVTRALLDHGHRAVGLCNVADRQPTDDCEAARCRAGSCGARSFRAQSPDLDPTGPGRRSRSTA